jgi:hypothetical protein
VWPRVSWLGLALPLLFALLALLALHDGARLDATVLTLVAAVLGGHALWECGCATRAVVRGADARPVEELEQALVERVREAQLPESESVGAQP